VYSPVFVGVPEIDPVVALIDMPGGSAPHTTLNV
jgi:hypothetical protein